MIPPNISFSVLDRKLSSLYRLNWNNQAYIGYFWVLKTIRTIINEEMQEEAVSEKHVKMMKEHFYVEDIKGELRDGLAIGLSYLNLIGTFDPSNSWIVTEESLVSFYRFLAKENGETVIETLIEKPSRLLGFETWPFGKLSKDEQIMTVLPATETSKLFFKST